MPSSLRAFFRSEVENGSWFSLGSVGVFGVVSFDKQSTDRFSNLKACKYDFNAVDEEFCNEFR